MIVFKLLLGCLCFFWSTLLSIHCQLSNLFWLTSVLMLLLGDWSDAVARWKPIFLARKWSLYGIEMYEKQNYVLVSVFLVNDKYSHEYRGISLTSCCPPIWLSCAWTMNREVHGQTVTHNSVKRCLHKWILISVEHYRSSHVGGQHDVKRNRSIQYHWGISFQHLEQLM